MGHLALGRIYRAVVETLEARRLLSAGQLDGDFDLDGVKTFDGGLGSGFTDTLVQPDGKVLAVGQLTGGSTRTGGLFRFNLDGTPDSSFGGGDGVADLPQFPSSDDFKMTLLGDGGIVVGGAIGNGAAVAMRFTATGGLDTTLGGTGYIAFNFGATMQDARVIAQPDGKIVIAGFKADAVAPAVIVRQYGVTGTPDSSFGTAGSFTIGLTSSPSTGSIAALPGGKLLVDGIDAGRDCFVARLTSGGALDATFAGGGKVEKVLTDGGGQLVPQADSSFYIVGEFFDGTTHQSLLAKFTAGGILDTSFAAGTGIVRGASGTSFYDGAVQLDGKILAVGGRGDFVAARFNTSGTSDSSFGTNGVQTTDVSGFDQGLAAALSPDGRLVAAGYAGDQLNGAIVRYTNEGVAKLSADGKLVSGVTANPGAQIMISAVGSGFEITLQDTFGFPTGATQRFANIFPELLIQSGGIQATFTINGPFGSLPAKITTGALFGDTILANSGNDDADEVAVFDDQFSIGDRTVLLGNAAAVRINTGGGVDFIQRTTGVARYALTLDAGAGNDLVQVDTLTGTGVTAVFGGAGDDTFWLTTDTAWNLDGGGEDDSLILSGTEGQDVLSFTADGVSSGAFVVAAVEHVTLNAGSGNDHINVLASVNYALTINGEDDGDILDAHAAVAPVTLSGGAGNDQLIGGLAADQLLGGTGNDSIAAQDSVADLIDGGEGTDAATTDPIDFTVNTESAVSGSIAGLVFEDLNGNGGKDAGENGLSGRTVFVDVNNDGSYTPGLGDFSVLTEADGSYSFQGLAAGTYKVGQVLPASWQQTVPAGGAQRTIVLATDFAAATNADFGSRIPPAPTQTPYKGIAYAISPAATTTIQVEDYDIGGEGIAYHDTETTNLGGKYRTTEGVDIETVAGDTGSFNVGYGKVGEWLEYSIDVATAGNYNFDFRVASTGNNGMFHVELDGVNVTGPLTVTNTGGWQTWKTLSKTGVALTQGPHILRLAMDALGSTAAVGNFNYITITGTPQPGAQTPSKGTPFAVTSAGATTIEVEDFDNGGEGVAFHDSDATNSGTKYRTTGVDIESTTDAGAGYDVGWTLAGEWLEFTLNVVDAGSYDLAFRVASSGVGGKFHAEIDGADVTGQLSIPSTGGWQSFTTLTKTGVSLTAGAHILRIAMDTVGAGGGTGNFNWVKISPAGVVPPPSNQTPFKGTPFAINNSAPTTIEVEDFDNGGEGIAYHDADAANSGGKYRTTGVDIETTTDAGAGSNIGYTKAGEWLEYSVDVANAGSYNFDFRVASSGAAGKFHLEVDGVDVTGQFTVASTGGWQTWQTLSKTGVSLTTGPHVLRLAMDSVGANGSVGNFNYIKVSPAGVVPPPTQTPFKGTPFAVSKSAAAQIEIEDFDNGGEGVAYHDLDAANSGGKYRTTGVDIESTTDAGGGSNIGYTKAGEWLEYTIDVATAASYDFDVRVASSGLGGKFHLEIDGVDVTGQLTVANTGGWQTWQNVSKTGVSLSTGQHVLRLFMDANGAGGYLGNFNYIRIS